MLVPEVRSDLVDRGLITDMELFGLAEFDGVLPRPFVSKFHECNPSGARMAGAGIRFRLASIPDAIPGPRPPESGGVCGSFALHDRGSRSRDVRVRRSLILVVLCRGSDRGEKLSGPFPRV